MTRYAAESIRWGEQEILVLSDVSGQRRLRIARHGAAVLGFEVTRNGTTHELADGYRDADEIVQGPGSRFAIMVPFAGRIGDARYSFDGHTQDMQPGATGSQRGIRHGFVRGVDFAVETMYADDDGASVTLGTAAIRPRPGYPHAIDLTVSFTLDAHGLTLEALMRNVGNEAAPCFFGWHPYFRLTADGIEDWLLQIPAQTLIRTDENLVPLAGQAAYVSQDDVPALDFRTPRRIGDAIIDQEYRDLDADPDGRIRTRLHDPVSGLGIAVWQEHGLMHAFTADTVSRGARRAVALEPMECMADAFSRPDCATAITLLPGAERRFRCGVEIAP